MIRRRIVVCLDVREGRTTKGVRFQDNIDVGDPVAMARRYYQAGADELVFYDITASAERRRIVLDLVERVAAEVFIPFAVGGGLGSAEDIRDVILAGAEKVSLNSQAVRNPELLRTGAEMYGSQAVVLGMDVRADSQMPSGYRVVIDGGRVDTGLDAVAWAQEAETLGAGEIVLNSIDADGVRSGYEITVTRAVADAVRIPVVASGGAGVPEHLVEVFREGHAHAALIASMVHFGDFTVGAIKEHLKGAGIPVRTDGISG